MKFFDVLNISDTYKELVKRMVNYDRMAWTRWGDGELMYMNGQWNRTDHKQNEKLQEELKEAFRISHKDFMIGLGAGYEVEGGMEPGVFAPFGNDNALIDIVNKFGVKNIYPNFILFHYLLVYQTETFKKFFDDFIKPKNIMFVTGQPIEAVEKLLGRSPTRYVKPTINNAYDQIDDCYYCIKEWCNSANIEVVLFACGMNSNVLQKRLWNDEINVKTIDIGSVIDVFSGDMKRTWVKQKREEILRRF